MHRRPEDPQDDAIVTILERAKRVAVVGLSDNPMRSSHGVTQALLRDGYEIVPVNPTVDSVFGIPSHASLADIPGHVDLVNIFRREEHLPAIAREAVEIGADAIWVQQGLVSTEARRIADDAGLHYVEDRCLKVEVAIRQVTPPA